MERLDYFGREISIRFKGYKTHKTKCGVFFTIAVLLLIAIRITFLVNDFITGNNPTLLYQEREVKNPKRFDITPETFTMMFGILDANYNYITDQTVLTVESVLETKKTIFNETTQQYQDNWQQTTIQMERCTLDLVNSDPSLISDLVYLDSHYCFSKGQQLYIEGEFHQDSFAQIYIYIKRCRGPQCQSEPVIQNALSDFFGEVIFTDVYVAPENKQKPFTMYVRDNFWENGPTFPQKVYMEMRNNYIESDYGFFLSSIHTDIFPSYSLTQQSVCQHFQNYLSNLVNTSSGIQFSNNTSALVGTNTGKRNNYLYFDNQKVTQVSGDIYSTFILRFEKKKENLYKRTYQNFLAIVTDLGGLLQVLTTFGILFTFFLTQTHLNQELINNTFTFKESKPKDGKQNKIRKCAVKNLSLNKGNSASSTKNTLFRESLNDQTNNTLVGKQVITQQSNNQLFPSLKKSSIQNNTVESKAIDKSEMLDSPANRIKQIISEHLEQRKKVVNVAEKAQQDASSFSKSKATNINSSSLLETTINQHANSMSFNLFDYIKSLFLRYGNFKRKKAIYDYSIDQLYRYLDVQWIINKLIEFDKLKRILLDDDQLLLFEYLPKPSICYSFNNNDQVEFHDNQSFTASKQSKNEIDNIQKAILSYKKLSIKSQLQQTDFRILKFMDATYKQIFEQESSSLNSIQQEDIQLKPCPIELGVKEQNESMKEQSKNEDQMPQEYFVQDEENVTHIEENLKLHSSLYKSLPLYSNSPSLPAKLTKIYQIHDKITNNNTYYCNQSQE